MMRRFISRSLMVLAVLVGGAVGFYAIRLLFPVQPHRAQVSSGPDVHIETPVRRITRDDYVGDQVCAGCHTEISERYRRSGMASSWRRLDESRLRDFAVTLHASGHVHDPAGAFDYEAVVTDTELYQEEVWRSDGDDSMSRLRRRAHYAVGSGNHAVAFVCESNGYLDQMPLAWFTAEQQWKMNPGYEAFNHRFDRPITTGCIACHGTFAEHVEPTRNRFHGPILDGIQCERCHGSGKTHVAYWENNHGQELDGARPATTRPEETIVNPARLPADLGNDVCLQCHLQGDVTLFANESDPFRFQPGDRLREQRFDFLIDTGKNESFGVASHGTRLLRSRCYLESDAGLTCFRCHDPHAPVSEISRQAYDAHCIECHQPNACARSAPEEEKLLATGCVECHMPQRSTREGQHLVFTDHWIRRRPTATVEPEVLQPNANVKLVSPWPTSESDPRRLGSAYVQLHETMGPQQAALRQGVAMLSQLYAAGDRDGDTLYWLGSGLISMRQSRDAIALLNEHIAKEPNSLRSRFRLAIAYDQLKDYPRAIGNYEKIIRAAPDWMEPYPLLSRLYLFQRQSDKAERLLEQQVQFAPDALAFANLAMAKWMQGQPPMTAIEWTDRALQLDPRHAHTLLVRAHLFTVAGEIDAAKDAYRSVLANDPGNPTARQGIESLPIER